MPHRRGRSLPAGLAYLIEHGHAADGSHADNTQPTQHLVNPRSESPTTHPAVKEWARHRAWADRQMQAAGRRS